MSQLQTPPYLAGKVRIVSFLEANEILRNPGFAAGRTEGVDRIECRRAGPPAELNVCGARFVVYST